MTENIHILRHGRLICHYRESGLAFSLPWNDVEGMQEHLLCPDCLRRWRNENPIQAVGKNEKREIRKNLKYEQSA